MSRLGKKPIAISSGVTVSVTRNTVTVKGNKGELSQEIFEGYTVTVEETVVVVKSENEGREFGANWGLLAVLITNMIKGVSEGYTKSLIVDGVGYRVKVTGNVVNLAVGYSHPVDMEIPKGLTVEVPSNTVLIISGIDKQVVGEFAAQIRKVRPPEPYKGKGIKYKEEVILRKEGKRAGK